MMVAIAAGVLGRWAHNENAIPSGVGVVEVIFMLLVLAALDQGATQDIAKGFAWLFLTAVLLNKNSIVTGVAGLANGTIKPPATVKKAK